MKTQSRREFIHSLAQRTGAVTAFTMLPRSIQAALSTPPAFRTGTIMDVGHVVIFMQENRSFDHYFGTLKGVRGFNDPRTIVLPNGEPVWRQPNLTGSGYILPFHMDTKTTCAQHVTDLPHAWHDQHQAWNNGRYDQWIAAKKTKETETPLTMGFHRREDVPYHFALADAFTICDQNFCSLLGPTDPNRLFHWTGHVFPDGVKKGLVIDNNGDDFTWTTYPERLESAGISWQVYQQSLTSDPENGNFEDNLLAYFETYKNAAPGSALHNRAMLPRTLDDFARDVAQDKLPQVSWMVAPERYSEHPSSPPGFGAYYTSKILDALTANPDVWSKTVFIINFDENDGFFDHVPPFTPPRSPTEGKTTMDVSDELYGFDKVPYGLGVRVPLLVISPWTCGGYVCSQVFDNTSTIQFLEARFGVHEPNISAWRRAVCGNLTSAFDFSKPDVASVRLPSTAEYKVIAENERHLPPPTEPPEQSMPRQEPGVRPARALPYEFQVEGTVLDSGKFSIKFTSSCDVGGAFNVYSRLPSGGPWKYAVGSHTSITDEWDVNDISKGAYDLEVFGANGFYRRFVGKVKSTSRLGNPNVEVTLRYDKAAGNVGISMTNHGDQACIVVVYDSLYKNGPERRHLLNPKQSGEDYRLLQASKQWYDLTVQIEGLAGYLRHYAGHMETGKDSTSDPALA